MTPSLAYERKLYCSFCGKGVEEVRKLIAGPTVFICDECVTLCQAIIANPDNAAPSEPRELSPAQETAVCKIVAEMLATMLEGTDGRIRDATSTIAVDVAGRISGITPDRQTREASPSATALTAGSPLGDQA